MPQNWRQDCADGGKAAAACASTADWHTACRVSTPITPSETGRSSAISIKCIGQGHTRTCPNAKDQAAISTCVEAAVAATTSHRLCITRPASAQEQCGTQGSEDCEEEGQSKGRGNRRRVKLTRTLYATVLYYLSTHVVGYHFCQSTSVANSWLLHEMS